MEGIEFGEHHDPAPGPKVLRWFEGLLVALAAACILGIGALITLTVITRTFFAFSIPDEVTFVQELMISCVILPLAYVTADRAHIMVEVFTNMMPKTAQPWLNTLSSLVGLLVLLPITYSGWANLNDVIAEEAYFYGDLELPEWPGRLAFFVGYITFIARLAILFVYDAISIFQPKTAAPSQPSDAS